MVMVSQFKLNTKNLLFWLVFFSILVSMVSFWNSLKTNKRLTRDKNQEQQVIDTKVIQTEKKVKRTTPPPTTLPPNFEVPHVRKFKLCSSIEAYLNRSSIADFGAGWGLFGRCWLRRFPKEEFYNETFYSSFIEGMKAVSLFDKKQVIASWEGYDNTANVKVATKGFVNSLDLELPFGLAKKFDWVVSLNVLQDINPEKINFFLDNLYTHARRGIILSWPPPVGKKQSFNRSSVIDQMKARGLNQHVKGEEFLIKTLNDTSYKDTLMVFTFIKKKK